MQRYVWKYIRKVFEFYHVLLLFQNAKDLVAILTPEIALPTQPDYEVTRYQASLNILATLDILTTNQKNL